MWRFGWVWFLIALFFTVVAFFSGFLACCGRIGAFISSMFSALALAFWTLAAVFMTYVPSPFLSPQPFWLQIPCRGNTTGKRWTGKC